MNIVERLRGAAYSLPSAPPSYGSIEWQPNNVCTEAADTIEALAEALKLAEGALDGECGTPECEMCTAYRAATAALRRVEG